MLAISGSSSHFEIRLGQPEGASAYKHTNSKGSAQWISEGDIRGCLDNNSHT